MRVTVADSAAFFELRRRAILGGRAKHYPLELLEVGTDPLTDGSLKEPLPPHFYFAMFADEIAACGMLDIEKGRIDVVFVSPKFLRHGIGWAMMRHLEIIAKECGVLTLTLDAVSFYRSLGFEGHAVGTFASPRQYRCTAFE